MALPPVGQERPPEIVLPRMVPARPAAGSQLGGFDDIRLEWTSGPSRYRLDSAATPLTGAGRLTPSQRASASWFGSPGLTTHGGFILGLGAAGWWARSDAAQATLLLRTYAFDLNAVHGLPLGRNLELEVVPNLWAAWMSR